VEQRATLSAARPRCRLWPEVPQASSDHIVIINERHLRRVLASYIAYYHQSRTHLSLDTECPEARPIQPPELGMIIAIPQVGGLHHRYERVAA
jgi:hypothetical protein